MAYAEATRLGTPAVVCFASCHVWLQDIAEENEGSKGEGLVRQQSAVQHATAVLLNKQAAPATLVLAYLPWLIAASPTHALNVLKV